MNAISTLYRNPLLNVVIVAVVVLSPLTATSPSPSSPVPPLHGRTLHCIIGIHEHSHGNGLVDSAPRIIHSSRGLLLATVAVVSRHGGVNYWGAVNPPLPTCLPATRKRELSRWLTVGAQSQCLCTQLQSSGYLRLHVARGLED